MNEAANNHRFPVEPEGEPLAPDAAADAAAIEPRKAPRFTLLIRAAKLVTPQGEFVCVIRDVSETGVSIRLFHDLPGGEPVELHLPAGNAYELRNVWLKGREAGFEFVETVDVARFINEAGAFPKRGLRLGLCFPVRIASLTQSCEGFVENLSQQGARISCDALFAIDQNLRIECTDPEIGFGEVRAKVRWRRDKEYGVVFDDTTSLSDFARLAARLQCPDVLD
ncbi:MAG: PilZ domain-containing protein [Erythrobacter sp.]|jgi:hypothetical protein|nr:PilZ domain-containing protein [Erythrobacter sp.]